MSPDQLPFRVALLDPLTAFERNDKYLVIDAGNTAKLLDVTVKGLVSVRR